MTGIFTAGRWADCDDLDIHCSQVCLSDDLDIQTLMSCELSLTVYSVSVMTWTHSCQVSCLWLCSQSVMTGAYILLSGGLAVIIGTYPAVRSAGCDHWDVPCCQVSWL